MDNKTLPSCAPGIDADRGRPQAAPPPVAALIVYDALIEMIARDLGASIANLGYPVGMGIAPHPDVCQSAAGKIVDRIKDAALELLAERQSPP